MSAVRRRAFSLIEVLLCIGLLATILVPIIDVFTNSGRVSHSAGRLVDVALHAQMQLEALAQLEPHELPITGPDVEELLVADGLPLTPSGGTRFQEWLVRFQAAPGITMQRKVVARRLATGEVQLRLTVSWLGIEGDERTRQTATFRMLAVPSVFGR